MTAKGKIILTGRIKNLSPLHIGCGSGDKSDLDVLRDSDGKPFIPATSFVGVLKHAIGSPDDSDYKQFSKKFWGFSENEDGHQSTFRCSDLLICKDKSPKITIRDGIKIDSKTGLVENKKKYDYEIVERGEIFDLRMEFSYKDDDKTFVKRMIATMCSLLKNEKIQIGSKTNSGLGVIILEDEKLYAFDFSKKTDVFYWLTQNLSEKNHEPKLLETPFQIKGRYFTIDATFQLKNSLIIRSYSDDPEMPDAVHIQSLGKPVLTGTSLKGAIRARAERIVNTVNTLGKSDSIIKKLFGDVEDEKHSKGIKGKIQVKECILPKFVSELQTRIKIDRFTGGTVDSALFDTMPLFSTSNPKEEVINITVCVRDYEDYEAGLLLLVLKDLWTGDLAVGGEKNVGRGVFEGVNAFIKFDGDEVFIDKDLSRISTENREKLQRCVKALAER